MEETPDELLVSIYQLRDEIRKLLPDGDGHSLMGQLEARIERYGVSSYREGRYAGIEISQEQTRIAARPFVERLIEQYEELYKVVLSEYETSSNPFPFRYLVIEFEAACAGLKRELMIGEK